MRLRGTSQESVSWATVHGGDYFGLIQCGEFHNYLNGCLFFNLRSALFS